MPQRFIVDSMLNTTRCIRVYPSAVEVASHLYVLRGIGLATSFRLDKMRVLVMRPEDQDEVNLEH